MLYNFVLYLHITVAILAFGLGGGLNIISHLLHRADSVGQVRLLAKALKLGAGFGAFDVVLLLLGIWLVRLSDDPDKFHFGDAFVWTGIVAIVILLVAGGAVLDPYAKQVNDAAAAAPDGPVTADLRAVIQSPRGLYVLGGATGLFLAVVFNMANKPGEIGSIAALVVGLAIGAASSMPLLKPPAAHGAV